MKEYYVNHKDGNPKNNNAENLEWVRRDTMYTAPKEKDESKEQDDEK